MSESESKIGLFLLTRDSSHQLASARAAEEAAARHRVPIEVSFADNLAVQQAQNIMKFVHADTRRRTCVIRTLAPLQTGGRSAARIAEVSREVMAG